MTGRVEVIGNASNNVVLLDSARPKLVITVNGNEREYLILEAIGWASGENPLPSSDVLRVIITEWLCGIAGITMGFHDGD